uniref:SCP domain-containing protein n=1 Tax=Angiostrongylus cantonensis TaxID=6313 RepID=A0A0K0DLH8_ANGCA
MNGENPDENAPPSSRMYRLRYDCIAEQLALNSVGTCSKRLSSPASRPGYDENIHAITTWSSELETNGIPSDMILTYPVSQRRQRMVLRVTKIIWGTNRHVGCATKRCDGFYFTSCMYQEPINVIGEKIYTIGPACGSCPFVPRSCNPSVGLCSPQILLFKN